MKCGHKYSIGRLSEFELIRAVRDELMAGNSARALAKILYWEYQASFETEVQEALKFETGERECQACMSEKP